MADAAKSANGAFKERVMRPLTLLVIEVIPKVKRAFDEILIKRVEQFVEHGVELIPGQLIPRVFLLYSLPFPFKLHVAPLV